MLFKLLKMLLEFKIFTKFPHALGDNCQFDEGFHFDFLFTDGNIPIDKLATAFTEVFPFLYVLYVLLTVLHE
jgi:hypothetical protein